MDIFMETMFSSVQSSYAKLYSFAKTFLRMKGKDLKDFELIMYWAAIERLRSICGENAAFLPECSYIFGNLGEKVDFDTMEKVLKHTDGIQKMAYNGLYLKGYIYSTFGPDTIRDLKKKIKTYLSDLFHLFSLLHGASDDLYGKETMLYNIFIGEDEPYWY